MKHARPTIPEPDFWPIADLAAAWNCSADCIEVHGACHDPAKRLEVTTLRVGERDIRGVTAAEKQRFEQLVHGPTISLEMPSGKKAKSVRAFIGLLVAMMAKPQDLSRPYVIKSEFVRTAGRMGIPVLISEDTMVRLISEGVASLTEDTGFRIPIAEPQCGSALDEAVSGDARTARSAVNE